MYPLTSHFADTVRRPIVLVHSAWHWPAVEHDVRDRIRQLGGMCDVLLLEPAHFLDDIRRPVLYDETVVGRVCRLMPRLPRRYDVHDTISQTAVRSLLTERLSAPHDGVDEAVAVHWFFSARSAPAMIEALPDRAVVYEPGWEQRPVGIDVADWEQRCRYVRQRADLIVTRTRPCSHPAGMPTEAHRLSNLDAVDLAARVGELVTRLVSTSARRLRG